MIDIAIIENDEVLRAAFKAYCQRSERLNCVFSVESTEKMIQYFSSKISVDVALIDLDLPGLDGFEAITYMKKLAPDIDIIVLTVYQDYASTFKALRRGAVGYLVKKLTFEEIEHYLIDLKDNGHLPLSPQIARRILQYFQPPLPTKKKIAEKVHLTPKELLVIKHLTNGKSYKATAQLMEISEHGVHFHVKKIYKKLHIKSKVALLNLYITGFFNEYFLR